MNDRLLLSSSVVLTPRRSGVLVGSDNTVDVLVRVQAPDAPDDQTAPRPPQAIALVIDKSGSMGGPPLAEARRCAKYVVGQLLPTDSVSLVEFDEEVRRLWPAAPLGDRRAVNDAIDQITEGGSTDLHGGWREGAETLSDVSGNSLKRVILLSDGNANHGLLDTAAIAAQCSQWLGRGVTTSTYGLGDSFNEDLMVAMARAGGGNHYYGATAEDLMEPFQRELDLLGNLCLRDVHLNVTVPTGITATVLNDMPSSSAGWRMPDLAWGAEAWVVIRLAVPASAQPSAGSSMHVLRVTISGLSLEGTPVQLERSGLSLPAMSSGSFDKLGEDELVVRRLSELEAASFLNRMRTAAAERNWALVDELLAEASRKFADNEWVSSILASMKSIAASRARERMLKEAMYSSASLNSRLVSRDEQMHFSVDMESASRPSYLRRKPSQGKGSN